MEHEEEMFNRMSADCAHRATLYDQRSKTMKDELKAMVQALRLLTGASAEPKRVQGSLKLEDSELQTRVSASKRRFELEQGGAGKSATVKPHSFLQEELTKQHPTSFLQRSSLEAQKKEALEVLNTEGQKLQSLMLLGLASDSKGSPFEKVKTLIENLIVRLENEAGQEVTKKGFCDTEMAKADVSPGGRVDRALGSREVPGGRPRHRQDPVEQPGQGAPAPPLEDRLDVAPV